MNIYIYIYIYKHTKFNNITNISILFRNFGNV